MLRAINFLFVLAGLFALSACNTPGCLIQDKAADASSSFLANVLECSNPDAVRASMVTLIGYTNICKQAENGAPQGTIANAVCPTIASFTVDNLAKNGIPAAWGCKATNVTKLGVTALTNACEMLPFLPNKN